MNRRGFLSAAPLALALPALPALATAPSIQEQILAHGASLRTLAVGLFPRASSTCVQVYGGGGIEISGSERVWRADPRIRAGGYWEDRCLGRWSSQIGFWGGEGVA